MYIYATLCIGACTTLASCTQSRPHSFLQRRRVRPAWECRMWELNSLMLWIVEYLMPNHCSNQWWPIADWTLRIKLAWNLYQNTKVVFQENALKNVACICYVLSGLRLSCSTIGFSFSHLHLNCVCLCPEQMLFYHISRVNCFVLENTAN